MPTIYLPTPNTAKVSRPVAEAFESLTRQLEQLRECAHRLSEQLREVSAQNDALRAKFAGAVKRRAAILRYAEPLLGGDVRVDELSDRELMEHAIVAVQTERAGTLGSLSDDYVLAIFDLLAGAGSAHAKRRLRLVKGADDATG